MTAQFFVVFEIWRFLWFFQKCSENFRKFKLIIFSKFEISNAIVRCCQGTLKSCKSCHKRLLNATALMLLVSEIWRFLTFSKFLEELIYKEIQKIWKYWLDEDATLLSAYNQASQILPLNMNAQILLVSEIRRFFFFIFFFGKLRF